MSSTARRFVVKDFLDHDIPDYTDGLGNVYNLTNIKRRHQRIRSAQLRMKTKIQVAGRTLILPHGQIIVFHKNGNPYKVRVEKLTIGESVVIPKIVIFLDSLGVSMTLGVSQKRKKKIFQ